MINRHSFVRHILLVRAFFFFAIMLALVVLLPLVHAYRSTRKPAKPVHANLSPAAIVTISSTPKRPQQPLVDHFAVPVLMYHRISDLTEKESRSPLMRDLTVSPAHFEEQVKYLTDNGFTCMLASDVDSAVREGKPLPERAVAITMDDGYRDNFDCAFPILKKYNVPATIFLVTSTVDTDGHLTWDNVHEMRPHPVGYGSHTVRHLDLTSLPPDQLDYELRESKRVLESKLLERITAVAYPSGAYNSEVTEKAREVGYLAGWKKGGGPVQPGDDPLLLPRVRVNGYATMDDFKRKVWSGVEVRKLGISTHNKRGRPEGRPLFLTSSR